MIVKKISNITLEPSAPEVTDDEQLYFTAKADYGDGKGYVQLTYNIIKKLTWYVNGNRIVWDEDDRYKLNGPADSGCSSIIRIDRRGYIAIYKKEDAASPYTGEITVKVEDEVSGKSASASACIKDRLNNPCINVKNSSELAIGHYFINLTPGDTIDLRKEISVYEHYGDMYYHRGTLEDLELPTTYETYNFIDEIASLDKNGILTIKSGEAVDKILAQNNSHLSIEIDIKVTIPYSMMEDGISKEPPVYLTVTVHNVKPASMDLTINSDTFADDDSVGLKDGSISLHIGESAFPKWKMKDANGFTSYVVQDMVWSIENSDSDDETVYASVDKNSGTITPLVLSEGKAYLVGVSTLDPNLGVKLALNISDGTSPVPTAEPTPTQSAEPTPTQSAEPTPTQSAEPTPTQSAEPTPTQSVEPTPTQSAEPTPTQSAEPTPTQSAEPTPTQSAEPTPTQSAEPTTKPTAKPTVKPTVKPTTKPTARPTVKPTAAPTAAPTAEPTAEPTPKPTVEPTAKPTAEPTAEPTAKPIAKGKVATRSSALNVRKGPGTSYDKIGALPKNTVITILKDEGEWLLVNYNKITGYVSAQYIKPLKDDTENPDNPDIVTGFVSTGGKSLRIRKSASYNSQVTKVISNGEKLVILKHGNEWTKVNHNGHIGYVATRYITINDK